VSHDLRTDAWCELCGWRFDSPKHCGRPERPPQPNEMTLYELATKRRDLLPDDDERTRYDI
jgi:hypothetical protein